MTTTDLARLDTAAAVAVFDTDDALTRLGKWVEAASNAQRLVAPLVGTPFVPAAYRPVIERGDTIEQIAEKRAVAVANATAAVLYGLSLGIDPLMSLQQIYVVHGRPGLYAKMMVALVQAHGHEVWTEDLTDTRAVVCGRRKGSGHTERITITMDMARRAKWTSNTKYTETPQDMLWARAAGRVCDRIASDVLKGIPTVEEIQDSIQVEAQAGANGGTRTVSRRRPEAAPATVVDAVEEPPLTDEQQTAPQPAEEPAAASITAAQQRKLHASLRDHDMADRDVALVWIAGVIDREITTTKDLTVAEAAAAIDALDSLGQDEPALDDETEEARKPPADPEV